MKKELAAALGLAGIVLLGVGIPLMLEFRSLSRPAAARAPTPRLVRAPAINVRKGLYCGNCASPLVLPEWGGAAGRDRDLFTPLSLKALDRPSGEAPKVSTRTAPGRPALRTEP